MSLNNLYTLSDVAVYDAESKEIILQIDRITISLSLEEFAFVMSEFEKSLKAMKDIVMTTVQRVDHNQEIN
jgi:hypothetical protein